MIKSDLIKCMKLSATVTAILFAALILTSCISASYTHRKYYPPAVPAPTSIKSGVVVVRPTSFTRQPEQTYAPGANHGPIMEETEIHAQDSRELLRAVNDATGGGGLISNMMNLVGGNMLALYTGGGALGVGAVFAGVQSLLHRKILANTTAAATQTAAKVADDHDAEIEDLQAQMKELNTKLDAQWAEAKHEGFLSGVSAGTAAALAGKPAPTA